MPNVAITKAGDYRGSRERTEAGFRFPLAARFQVMRVLCQAVALTRADQPIERRQVLGELAEGA